MTESRIVESIQKQSQAPVSPAKIVMSPQPKVSPIVAQSSRFNNKTNNFNKPPVRRAAGRGR